MRVVAHMDRFVCFDAGDRWDLYDTVGQRIIDFALKESKPNFLTALVAKWGYERVDFEADYSIEPDLEALGLTEGDLEEVRKSSGLKSLKESELALREIVGRVEG